MIPAAIVIGGSSGGLAALRDLLGNLTESMPPIAIVLHQAPTADDAMTAALQQHCRLRVREAAEKIVMQHGSVYVAPADYHLLVERDRTLALCVDPRVNNCRPAIDVLFESAAEAFGPSLVGVVLTGANADGAAGLKAIKSFGGQVMVEDPDRAHSPTMPRAALAATKADRIGSPREIASILCRMARGDPP